VNLRGHRLIVGALVWAVLAGVGLAIVGLSGVRNLSSGYLDPSSMVWSRQSLAILLFGIVALLELDLARKIRRARRLQIHAGRQ
jgi:lipopolysaccharide export LptBFGC system permease protein LptF